MALAAPESVTSYDAVAPVVWPVLRVGTKISDFCAKTLLIHTKPNTHSILFQPYVPHTSYV